MILYPLTLTVTIYYPPAKNYTQLCKYFFTNTLPKSLESLGKIKPVVFATIKYRNQSSAGILKYSIKDVTPEFFIKLFEILEKKKRMNSFIREYSVELSNYFTVDDFKEVD
ncbi:MAG: hypothetical protein ACP5IC_02505 [Minisyncoccia bacterium]